MTDQLTEQKIRIVEADSIKLMHEFIKFPHQLYQHDKNYVPALNLLQAEILSKKGNPFFHHGNTRYFLAVDEDENILGRITAIYNQLHLDLYKDNTGFFGFFDCINDPVIAGRLLDSAAAWLRTQGLTKMMGPENLTTHDSVGILTKGFNDPPCFLMPYNFSYYKELLIQNGYKKALTLFSYKVEPGALPENMYQKSDILENRLNKHGIRIRRLDMKNFNHEMSELQKVYNQANQSNWGFTPLDEVAFKHMANDLRKLVDDESVLLAEKEGKLIGFSVALPDYNQVFKKIPRGKLFPFGWWYLLRGKTYISRIRIMILGVLPEWRGLGIDWCLYTRIADYTRKNNFEYGEACYVMENNIPMNKIMNTLGAHIVKEYQLFEKSI